ncbi:MAG: FkbM family methyltransferase [Sphingomonadales bacterium]|nr:FkbM family methyltransferase [Sphingomonadales bacterium]
MRGALVRDAGAPAVQSRRVRAREVAIFDCAAGEREDVASFRTNETNRGESRVAVGGERQVRTRPLAAMIDEAAAPAIDAMKIDIEGGESAALRGLFTSAGPRYRPALIIMELSHSSGEAEALLAAEGYREILRTRRNGVFARS